MAAEISHASDAEAESAYLTPGEADTSHDVDQGSTSATHYFAPEPPPAPIAASVSDDSDLPAFLRDDPPAAATPPSQSYVPEPEHSSFVAPHGETPKDGLVDEVDAAFIASGLPTQELSSPSALSAAETLESVARRLRKGDLRLQSGATAASEAATLAAVLAALLADA
jgi:hypothetical protein